MYLGIENMSFYVFVGARQGPIPAGPHQGPGEGPGEGPGPSQGPIRAGPHQGPGPRRARSPQGPTGPRRAQSPQGPTRGGPRGGPTRVYNMRL